MPEIASPHATNSISRRLKVVTRVTRDSLVLAFGFTDLPPVGELGPGNIHQLRAKRIDLLSSGRRELAACLFRLFRWLGLTECVVGTDRQLPDHHQ